MIARLPQHVSLHYDGILVGGWVVWEAEHTKEYCMSTILEWPPSVEGIGIVSYDMDSLLQRERCTWSAFARTWELHSEIATLVRSSILAASQDRMPQSYTYRE